MSDRGAGRAPPGPARASRRLPWTDVSFAALDFETTGLDLANDSVVSWGVVPVTGGGIEVRGATYRLVAPERPLGADSIRIHELRPVDLATAPPLGEIGDTLREALADRFLLAWAAGIEIAFLRRMFGGSERSWRRRALDVRELAVARVTREDPPPAGPVSLEDACRLLGVPVERTHHAFDDALMTAELFLVLAGGLGVTKGRSPTVRDLARAARVGRNGLPLRPATNGPAGSSRGPRPG
jgi:DNA polymerase-3 subunit epsilon